MDDGSIRCAWETGGWSGDVGKPEPYASVWGGTLSAISSAFKALGTELSKMNSVVRVLRVCPLSFHPWNICTEFARVDKKSLVRDKHTLPEPTQIPQYSSFQK